MSRHTKTRPKAPKRTAKHKVVEACVVVSDLHCGCQLGLCHEKSILLDEGGFYTPSELQQKLWKWWREFWDEWVPFVTGNEPYCVVVNGDVIDGVHHRSVTQITHNLADQIKIAHLILSEVAERCDHRLFFIRGTEAHAGPSAEYEELLAKELGAIKARDGKSSRYDLLLEIGGGLAHFAHHISVSGSMHYESTALMKELSESFVECTRWGSRHPDMIVRSHRHRHMEVRCYTASGLTTVVTTPGWQLKTPFAYKMPGARPALPQIGGIVIRWHKNTLFTQAFIKNIQHAEPELVYVKKSNHRRRVTS